MQLEELVDRLEGVRGNKALCPAHEDRTASLTFAESDDGTILLTCWAGCELKDICDALSIRVSDLFPEQDEVVYVYRDENGRPLYDKIRQPGKQFGYRRYVGESTEWGMGDVEKTLYHLDEIVNAEDQTRWIWITEGEKDADAIRAAGGLATTMGGVNDWRQEFSEYFRDRNVLVCMDKDQPGRDCACNVVLDLQNVAAKVRMVEASEGKDAYDHIVRHGLGLEDFSAPRLFDRLDLRKPIVEPPSLWRGYVFVGDLVLAAGAPKLGKSWLTMALAVIMANGGGWLLGQEVKAGRVLYFDEENPPDVIQRRMRSLGLTDQGLEHMFIVSNGGLRIDKHPELLTQQALMFQADLIVIDSLARVHAKDENSFSEMSEILNGVLRKLSRESGAAVMFIHHHDKAGNGPRGSSDIEAAVDTILNVRGNPGDGEFSLSMKGRRRRSERPVTVQIVDIPGGVTKLEAH